MYNFFEKFFVNVNKEGHTTIGIVATLSVILFFLSSILGILGVFFSILIIYFFRDPQRAIPIMQDVVLSPADGTVCKIEQCYSPESMGFSEKMHKISIYLSPLNVHVNRIPIAGTVKKLHYVPGKSLRADYDSSEDKNERQEILIETEDGKKVIVVQQTGFLARRIVCHLNHEEKVEAGKRFGIIKFGSRVTVYLPEDANISLNIGQTVVGGETIIATFADNIPITTEHFID